MSDNLMREEWNEVCSILSEKFSDLRKQQFQIYIEWLKNAESELDGNPIEIVNSHLGKEAIYAMKAYQMVEAMGVIASQMYISPEDGEDFADLLNAYVCGEDVLKCKDYFTRYWDLASDKGRQIFAVTTDIAKYITGHDTVVQEALIIADPFVSYSLMVDAYIALTFNDEESAEKLFEGIKARTNQ